MSSIDPQEIAKKSLLKDKRTVAAYGQLVIESGAFVLPENILTGVLLEALKSYQFQDRVKVEGWREAGDRFRDVKSPSKGDIGQHSEESPETRERQAANAS